MNCRMCGSPLKEGAKFCTQCGQVVEYEPVPQNTNEEQGAKKKKVSKITLLMSCLSLILAIALAVVLLLPRPEPNIAGVMITEKTFSTPREAVSYFVEGAKNCDIQKMSEAFGVEKIPDGYDFTAYCSRLKLITPNFMMPDKYSQFTSLNRLQQLGQCISSYKLVLYGLNGLSPQKTITKVDDASIKEYVEKINPGSLKNIRLSKFEDFPKANDPTHLKNMKDMAATYGADEAKVYQVELECSGKKVYCDTLQVVRYGGSWYIGSALFNME